MYLIKNHTLTRFQALKDQLTNIKSELDTLKNFRLTPPLKRFKRQLEGEASVIRAKIKAQETIRNSESKS